MRLVRALLFVKLGFWAGTITSALLVKRLLPSRGGADSEDPDAPRLVIDGFALSGGIAVGAKPASS